MATLLELFTEDDFALIFEALESRKKHYAKAARFLFPTIGIRFD